MTARSSIFGFEADASKMEAVDSSPASAAHVNTTDADADTDSDADALLSGDTVVMKFRKASCVGYVKEDVDALLAGDIVVIKFREAPCLGYVKEYRGVIATVVPLRETDAKTCSWEKAGKTTTKARWECIKVPSKLSDMKISI